jgi:predicted alpha/beta superfamily hydrolase
MKYTFSLLFTLFLLSAGVNGQTNVVDIEKKDTLFSHILDEKRPLRIYLPEDYAKDSVKYPVIYLLDGEWRFVHGVSTVRFLTAEGFMPKAIVVGIPNVARERDFLPDKAADRFRGFITEELISYIEKHYRADSFRILIGHSFGGVFAMHMLSTQPDAFAGYIMIDPALWYENKVVIRSTQKMFSERSSLPKTVYISGNEGKAWHNMSIDMADSLFKAAAPKDMLWKTCAYANETHVSVAFKTIYDGLRLVFNDYRRTPGTLIPFEGMFVAGKPYEIIVSSELSTLYYSTDGTNPTKASAKTNIDPVSHFGMIPIDKPSVLHVSSATSYQGTSVVKGNYFSAEPMEPVKKTGKLASGVRYKAYAGTWDKLPDFSVLKPYATGSLKSFVMPDSINNTGFGIQYEGYLFAKQEGYYDLAISSNDGSRLYVNNRLIIDLDGIHNSDDLVVYRLYLKAGYHAIKLDYFNRGGDQSLTMEFLKYPWTLQNVDLKIGEDELFYREK